MQCKPWCRQGDGHPEETYLVGYADPGQAPYLGISAQTDVREQFWDMTPDEARALAEQLLRKATGR